jgi:hypothetical protein
MQAQRDYTYALSTPVLHSTRSNAHSVTSFRSMTDGGEPTPRELRLRQHLDAIRRARGV